MDNTFVLRIQDSLTDLIEYLLQELWKLLLCLSHVTKRYGMYVSLFVCS